MVFSISLSRANCPRSSIVPMDLRFNQSWTSFVILHFSIIFIWSLRSRIFSRSALWSHSWAIIFRRNWAALTMALSFLAPARFMITLISSTSVRWIRMQLSKSTVLPDMGTSIKPRFIMICTVRLVESLNWERQRSCKCVETRWKQ